SANMLQSFSQSQDWLYTEPLLFDDEFCQNLMKDLQRLPTPPQSPPMKPGLGGTKPLSKEDQLSYVSDILLEDHDMQLNWNSDFFHSQESKEGDVGEPCSPLEEEEGGEDCLWQCLSGDKSLEEKLVSSMLGSSPLLSDINTSIFEEIAGSTLDCQNLMEPGEATSDYGSTGGELSTYSSSDSAFYQRERSSQISGIPLIIPVSGSEPRQSILSPAHSRSKATPTCNLQRGAGLKSQTDRHMREEEIDVVTVVRCSSSPSPRTSLADLSARQQKQEEQQRAQQRQHFEIQSQHNYAAPCPASPPPSSNKRSRGSDGSSRYRHSSRNPSSSSSR
ncbi:hypothetical protein KUCAC02_022215, partial [Chaenocephalus aceratus]